jgi:serine/threonine-protein kinase HipA
VPAERRVVDVHADWLGLAEPTRMGQLCATSARGKEIFSFEFDDNWLAAEHTTALDPTLRLGPGPQYLADGRENFGIFLDSSPDRWGRVLLQRREAQLARAERRKERRLLELDYLLGVFDGHRLGGLRYRIGTGPFLDDDATLASPPWTSLRELEQASLHFERDVDGDDPHYAKWLRLLIAPGRSLGGARPKASVLDARGQLWLAKFPSDRDESDIGAWESVVAALAKRAGIQTPETLCRRFSSRFHTFLSRRFDRSAEGRRLHFVSSMTLLERRDGEEGASYLDLANVIIQHGARAAPDLEQLWRRVVFSICVSNVDDHLRNHGFLLESHGFRLAPAFDVNPVPLADGLTLNISETDNALDLALARDVAKFFRVDARRADAIIVEVVRAVRLWRGQAKTAGISRAEQERMASAFAIAQAYRL